MICHDCDSPAVRFFAGYMPVCNGCYERQRNRTGDRRLYRKLWKAANRERQLAYAAKWRKNNRRYQYNSHILAWYAVQPVNYRVQHDSHIKEYLHIHKSVNPNFNGWDRLRVREMLRSVAREEVRNLVAAPPELTMKQIKKKQRNLRYRRENHSAMLEYYRTYRERNREKVLISSRERHRRRRLEGDAAIVVLRELGVKL